MATNKETEVSSHEHEHPNYQGANGTSNDLGRQISVTLTQAQFEGMYRSSEKTSVLLAHIHV